MKVLVALLAAALAAQVAVAQPPDDTTDVDTSTTGAGASPVDPGKAPIVTDQELRLDGERTDIDRSYDTSVLGAFRVTQGGQGPLDGAWHVAGADGVALYTLQITDPGAGEARIEGAWRNLKTSGPGASGFIDKVWRENDELVFSFRDGPREIPTQVRLHPSGSGGWAGETVIGDKTLGIVANRAQGVETEALAVPEWRAPPPPKAKPKAKRKTSKSKAKSSRSKSKSKKR